MTKLEKILIILGQEQLLIDQKINEVLKKNNLDPDEVVFIHLDVSIHEIQDIIWEINSPVFFASKIITIETDGWNKLKLANKKIILKAVQKTNNWIFFIFRKPLPISLKQTFSKIASIEQLGKTTVNKKKQLIIQTFKKNNICWKQEAIDYLVKNLPNNLMITKQELNKIENYIIIYPQILDQNVCQRIINKYKSGTIFPLIEGLLENNKSKIVNSYQNLMGKDEIEPLILLATLQTYLFLIKKTKVLIEQKLNLMAITQKLKKSNFFIINLMKIIKKTNNEKLTILIKKMYNLEYNLKLSRINNKVLLELFLIS